MSILAITSFAALLASASPLPAAALQPTPVTSAGVAPATTQLPRGVEPLRYDLTIRPDANAMTFEGEATILADLTLPTARIVLNAADLQFDNAVVTASSGAFTAKARVEIDKTRQTAALLLSRTLPAGRYEIAISYKGKIQRSTAGLFALDYTGSDAKPKRALFTQFENSDARRLFPSWDEPAYKAIFRLQAVIPAEQTALSNMPATSRVMTTDGRQIISFAPTPRMSSYLLFLGVGDLERTSKVVDGVDVGVVTQRGRLDQADFALRSAAQVLPWYNSYFGTAFPLPKLDNIAGPGQSQTFGAMENWGAVFSFERSFLLDPATASERQKAGIYQTLAHEMAHQWFGDLVTMRWWDDLWLNEGFASWMEGETTARFHPEWTPEFDILRYRDEAMGDDALATSHPVVQHVATAEEASEAFDSITYMKGQAVIRMLETYVGSDPWRDAVRAYIRRHAYGNTTTEDLWREVDAVSGGNVSQIAHDFTLQPGVPLIRASRSCVTGATILTLNQGEWSKDRPNKPASLWHVPVLAGHPGETPVGSVVNRTGRLTVPGCGPVIVNAGQTGYYRTLYAPDMFAELTKAFPTIAPIDQMGLITDAAALGLSGYQPMSDVLDLIDKMPPTTAPRVIGSAADTWSSLYGYADGDAPGQAALRAFAVRRFLPVLDRLGWVPKDGESSNDSNLRTTLIDVLGGAGIAQVAAEARRRFFADDTAKQAIAPSLRRVVLRVVARNADEAAWDRLHQMALHETSVQQRQMLYTLLGTARSPALQDRALALAITAEPGPTTSPNMIISVAALDPMKAVEFVITNKARIMPDLDSLSASTFLTDMAAESHDPAMIERMKAYGAEQTRSGGSARPSNEAIAAIQDHIHIRSTAMPAVYAWLAAKGN